MPWKNCKDQNVKQGMFDWLQYLTLCLWKGCLQTLQHIQHFSFHIIINLGHPYILNIFLWIFLVPIMKVLNNLIWEFLVKFDL